TQATIFTACQAFNTLRAELDLDDRYFFLVYLLASFAYVVLQALQMLRLGRRFYTSGDHQTTMYYVIIILSIMLTVIIIGEIASMFSLGLSQPNMSLYMIGVLVSLMACKTAIWCKYPPFRSSNHASFAQTCAHVRLCPKQMSSSP